MYAGESEGRYTQSHMYQVTGVHHWMVKAKCKLCFLYMSAIQNTRRAIRFPSTWVFIVPGAES